MKESLPPAAIAGIVAVVLVILVVVGMKTLGASRSSGPSPAEYRKKMAEHLGPNGAPPNTGGRPGYGSPGPGGMHSSYGGYASHGAPYSGGPPPNSGGR